VSTYNSRRPRTSTYANNLQSIYEDEITRLDLNKFTSIVHGEQVREDSERDDLFNPMLVNRYLLSMELVGEFEREPDKDAESGGAISFPGVEE
jgi:hypothetical protein